VDNHLRQAAHNEAPLDHLERSHPHAFNDWKVTLVFYSALHHLRAYCHHSKVSVGMSHKELQIAMSNQGSSVPNLDVDIDCTNHYNSLYAASRQARYDGMENEAIFEHSNQKRLTFSKLKLQKIKTHLQVKGLPI
jgi:hypothetical protein